MHTILIAKTQQHPETFLHYEIRIFQSTEYFVDTYSHGLFNDTIFCESLEEALEAFHRIRGDLPISYHLPGVFDKYKCHANSSQSIIDKQSQIRPLP
jgi:hypothetical protein